MPQPTPATPHWMMTPTAPQRPTVGSSRHRERFCIALLALILFSAALGVATWFRPFQAPYFVPLWVTDYRSSVIPDRGEAKEDRAALLAAGFFPQMADTETTQESALLISEFQELQSLPAHQAVVIYLSGYAITTPDEDIQLIPADAEPPLLQLGISIQHIMREMMLAPPRRKLLVLDLSPPPPNPFLGFLRHDTVADIPALYEQLLTERAQDSASNNTGELFVLLSCSRGQRPNNSQILGRTVFGYYFEQGLQGGALPWETSQNAWNHRISVRSLAAFLRARVDRWVRENHGERQTPILLGDGADFDLSVAGQAKRPVPNPPDTPSTVDPLTHAETLLHTWRTDGTLSLSPRWYQKIQTAAHIIKMEERSGRFGIKAGKDYKSLLDSLIDNILQSKAQWESQLPNLDFPSSLARATRTGDKTDADVMTALQALFQADREIPANNPSARTAAREKGIQAFVKAAAGKSAFAVESALMEQAWACADNPEQLALLGSVITARNTRLAYMETRFLERWITFITQLPSEQWNPRLTRAALAAVTKTEEVCARPELIMWAKDILDECVRNRWEGEILVNNWNYVPLTEIERRFAECSRLAGILITFSDTFQAARTATDLTLANLLPQVAWLTANPDRYSLWQDELQAVQAIAPLLQPSPQPQTAANLQSLTSRLRYEAAILQDRVNLLNNTAYGTAADWMLTAADQSNTGADVWKRINAVLTLPAMPLARRAAFQAAHTHLAQSLNAKTITNDNSDNDNKIKTDAIPYQFSMTGQETTHEIRAMQIRVRCHIDTLRLCGLPEATLKPLEDDLAQATRQNDSTARVWLDLAAGLSQAWSTGIAARYSTASPPLRDLIAGVVPGLLPVPQLDTPNGGPRIPVRFNLLQQFAEWNAGWYLYAAHSGIDSAYFHDLAQLVTPATSLPPMMNLMTISGPVPPIRLEPQRLAGSTRFSVQVPNAHSSTLPRIRAWVPGTTVQVQVAEQMNPSLLDSSGQTGIVPIHAELSTRTAVASAPPGFLIELSYAGRSTFARVPLDMSRLSQPMDWILSASADRPESLGDSVRVRPGSPQSVYVFARNNTNKPQQVQVTLSQAGSPFPGGEAIVTIPPGQTVPVPFTGQPTTTPSTTNPATDSGTSHPDRRPTLALPTSITLTAVDPKAPKTILAQRTFPLRVVHPYEYVQLIQSTFEPVSPPTRPQNQLTVALRAKRDLGANPSVAELILDPQNIPGLRGVRQGRLAGTIPSGGAPLVLDATGLQLDPEAKTQGEVTLTIDGVAQVFRLNVDLARTGTPTMPRLDPTPHLHLRLTPPPIPGQSIAFAVGADHAPPGATIAVQLLRSESDVPSVERTETFPAARSEQTRIAMGSASGGLQILATIADWSGSWDVAQLLGQRTLQARLLSATGQVLATRNLPVVLDDSPPIRVAFRDPPRTAKRGQPLMLSATGSDPESGIASIAFCLGKLMDGKPPTTAVFTPGIASPGDTATWTAAVPLPPTAQGPTDFIAKVINHAGLITYATATVDLVDKLPVQPGAIAGQLLLGSTPQASLTVNLSDARGKVLKNATTDPNGRFRFDDLSAGTYQLSAAKVTPPRVATATVSVQNGNVSRVELSLYLKANTP
ncbi:MAG: carboxypeptidase regulatory-like domain-containing protein [Bacteroidales bacterium]|nr:carboxypeptidase regulatory-like domain-containing protein [Bacteroidales bacterium]